MRDAPSRAPKQMGGFEPFYLKDSFLWVPCTINNRRRLLYLTPEDAWSAISYALPILGNVGSVVPFARRALSKIRTPPQH